MVKNLVLSLLLALPASLFSVVVETRVNYGIDGNLFEGWHVYDDALEGPRPGVLVVHQWTGISDYERRRARMLAEFGYSVFVADVYGAGVRPQGREAGVEAGKYRRDRELFRSRLLAALALLKNAPETDPQRVAAIGYCFGGTGVLELARAGVDLAGVVAFHGGLTSEEGFRAVPGGVRAKVLVLHGAVDPFVPPAEVDAFLTEMNQAGADYQFVAYSGAVHSFTHQEAGNDPSRGAAYQEAADIRSWIAMQTFFAEIFTQP